MIIHLTIAIALLGPGVALQTSNQTGWSACDPRHNKELSIRVSQGVAQGVFLHADEYEDTNLAHDAPKLKGDVQLRVLINPQGELICAEMVSSSLPMLMSGALEAAKRARFKPYIIQGQPVFVETHLTIHEKRGKFTVVWPEDKTRH